MSVVVKPFVAAYAAVVTVGFLAWWGITSVWQRIKGEK
ncbi:hypothetical protein J2S57_005107 [Kineosporia succinea]|uniref:Uncharacterized protein n=1 Tax=Kineosporia succinea TaxID=84632 RepID=A0ABT9P9J4_9ACTN|nr:hypothetical protein [Kineosporia succinea]